MYVYIYDRTQLTKLPPLTNAALQFLYKLTHFMKLSLLLFIMERNLPTIQLPSWMLFSLGGQYFLR